MKNNDIEVKITDYIDDQHNAHYWYGGQCAVIKYKGYTFSIEATGDVYWYTNKNGQVSECWKDKNNSGRFYSEMCDEYANDTALYDAIESGELVFDYNNWWECFVYDKDGEFYDLMWDLDSIRLDDAIEEVKANIKSVIQNIEED